VLDGMGRSCYNSGRRRGGTDVLFFWPVTRFLWMVNLWKVLVGVCAWLFYGGSLRSKRGIFVEENQV